MSLPLAQIPSVAHRRRWKPLTTKNSQAMGDLCFDCWVLSFKNPSSAAGGKWNNTFLASFKASSAAKERSKRRSSIEGASISRRGSKSLESLYTTPDLKPEKPPIKKNSKISLKATRSSGISIPRSPSIVSPPDSVLSVLPAFKPRLAPTLGQVLSSSKAPEITGLSPRTGPTSGGTRITVRGCNLGMSGEDILSITVCGCNLSSTLEYHTPAKLVVITKPWTGAGPVVLVTKSGGRGTSTVTFSFQDSGKGKMGLLLDSHLLPLFVLVFL